MEAQSSKEESSAVRTFLKCRTVGLPIAHSRLLGYIQPPFYAWLAKVMSHMGGNSGLQG